MKSVKEKSVNNDKYGIMIIVIAWWKIIMWSVESEDEKENKKTKK